MTEILLIVLIVLSLGILLLLLLKPRDGNVQESLRSLLFSLEGLDKSIARTEGSLRDELSRGREEAGRSAKDAREELMNSLHAFTQSMSAAMGNMAEMQKGQLEMFSDQLTARLNAFQSTINDNAKVNRDELSTSLTAVSKSLTEGMAQAAQMQKDQLDSFGSSLDRLTKANEEKLTQLTNSLGVKLEGVQAQMETSARNDRNELNNGLRAFQDQFKTSVTEFNTIQQQKFDGLIAQQTTLVQTTEQRLEHVREVVETKLKSIQDDNSEKLERMRQTVDEKLQKTLDDRLGESFKQVSDRLEQVYRGLGEMQTLANGVGDLKKVLSNVRTRGTLGEYRLEMILEQILAPEQYGRAVVTKEGSRENVEFAVKIPSKDVEGEIVLLPIDSKFPQDRYQALLDAYETADAAIIEAATKELEKAVKLQAKSICEKYLNPPVTMDFAIMFLPFEGLYAEVVKHIDWLELLQRDYHVSVVGPSTCAAFLHSLQMGFRTLAIQRRSSEVWQLLGAVKTDFGKFATILEGVEKNLQTASNKIHEASKKSRTIERKLRSVESLPAAEVPALIGEGLDEQEEPSKEEEEPNIT